ncbi:hypothetical protein RchiOBHm_Chr2g0160491 [Rosa chinensis]|uniref:Uncharacterized protein n=1 Tax=Rosa chinensis TaxID=74649 RepID=A0A2P6S2H6_ROSCH|nr:hypothetical protein RchiOBHm_Chr2g0160491 [Rosa chinensis]
METLRSKIKVGDNCSWVSHLSLLSCPNIRPYSNQASSDFDRMEFLLPAIYTWLLCFCFCIEIVLSFNPLVVKESVSLLLCFVPC